MWEYIEKVKTILIIIASGLTIKNQIDSVFIKQQLKEAHQFLIMIAQQSLYNKIGIGLSALLLFFSCIYTLIIFAIALSKGFSVAYSLTVLSLFLIASINLFYQSLKLYK